MATLACLLAGGAMGCGGFSAAHSVSPLSLLLPGFAANENQPKGENSPLEEPGEPVLAASGTVSQ